MPFIMEAQQLFDREIPFQDFHANMPDVTGKHVQVCTVRQRRISDLSMGTLYWLIQAKRAKKKGAKVQIADFYDKKNTPSDETFSLMEDLNIEAGREKCDLQRAEELERNQQAWERFCDYVREHRVEKELWSTIGTVRDGVEEVLASASYDVPPAMERFIEELSVWVQNINDPDAIQILNHECETTAWVRRLYPGAKKQFWRITLPMVNEYRGNIKAVLDGEATTVQRRISDLPQKLADADSGNETKEQAEFYSLLFEELIEIFKEGNESRHGHISNTVIPKLMKLDPALLAFYIERLDESNACEVNLNRDIEEYDYEDFLSWLLSGMSMIARSELKKKKPSLKRLYKLAKVIPSIPYLYPGGTSRKEFNSLLLNGKFSFDELANFWLHFAEANKYELHYGGLWAHPVVDLIAEKADKSSDVWKEIRTLYVEAVKKSKPHRLRGKIQDVPLCKRILEEVFEENPEDLFSMALVYFDESGEWSGLHSPKEDLVFAKTLLIRYLSASYCPQSARAQFMLDEVKKRITTIEARKDNMRFLQEGGTDSDDSEEH